jgi:tRNA modification GTPase
LADLVLWLGEPGEAPDPARTILVQSKCDLPGADRKADVRVSAHTREGIRDLIEVMAERARRLLPGEGELAVNARQRKAIDQGRRYLGEAGTADMLIAAEALRQVRIELDRVIGHAGVEDMLDMLFGRFCIGK